MVAPNKLIRWHLSRLFIFFTLRCRWRNETVARATVCTSVRPPMKFKLRKVFDHLTCLVYASKYDYIHIWIPPQWKQIPSCFTCDAQKALWYFQAWTLHESNRELELIDPALSSYDKKQATRMIGVALMCVQASPSLRPAMSRVIAMFSGDVKISAVLTKPSYLTDWDFSDTTFFEDEPTPSQTTMPTTTTTATSTGVESMSSPIIMSELANNQSLREGRWHIS